MSIKKLNIIIAVGILGASLILSGCFSNGTQGGGPRLRGDSSRASAGGSSATPRQSAPRSGKVVVVQNVQIPANWQFMGYSTLDWVLRQELKITGSNRNPAAEAEVLSLLQSHQADLGGSNLAMGQTESLNAEPVKFKFLTEIVSQACYLALPGDPNVQKRLFPVIFGGGGNWSSPTAFDAIFLRLLGRAPALQEMEILRRMIADIAAKGSPLANQAAAVCTAVMSTLEFAHAR